MLSQYLTAAIVGCAFFALALRVAYNVLLHPLSRFPGRWQWTGMRISMLSAMMAGSLPYQVKKMHDEMGPVVRTAPDELSFTDPAAWIDIYGNKAWSRPLQWRPRNPGSKIDNLLSADAATHARLRKAIGPGFSSRAVRRYEETVQGHVDKMVEKLQAMRQTSAAKGDNVQVDLARWINFCTFDIIMDIGWGSTLRLLDKGFYHPWVVNATRYRELCLCTCFKYYPPLWDILERLMPKFMHDALETLMRVARDNVSERLKLGAERADMFSLAFGDGGQVGTGLDKSAISREELDHMSMVITLAGSEPISTSFCGILHQLLRSRRCTDLLHAELKGAFPSPSHVDERLAETLPYLNAVIKEGMRLSPPFPDGMRREVPAGGAVVAGIHLQPGTVVAIPCWSMFRSPRNFERPNEFVPERWLEKPIVPGGLCSADFTRDRTDAFHPFSYGPRACLGGNLAWLEMRVLLSRLLLSFRLVANDKQLSRSWDQQRVFWAVERHDITVGLEAAT